MHRGGCQLSRAETELKRAENLIEHHDEIMARPARTWFQSASQKRAEHGPPPVPRRWVWAAGVPSADGLSRNPFRRFCTRRAVGQGARGQHEGQDGRGRGRVGASGARERASCRRGVWAGGI